jgi:hypothetical protein
MYSTTKRLKKAVKKGTKNEGIADYQKGSS